MTFGASLPSLVAPLPGPRSRALVDTLARTESPALTARRARRHEATGAPQDPVVWREARGVNVRDADGNVLVDLAAGFGVIALGHGHARIASAIAAQSAALVHGFGDVHPSEVKVELLARLAALAPWEGARVILGAHGSDAIEAALKTAMLHTRRPGVLAFEHGYHGLAHGPLAISDYQPAFRAPFAAQLSAHVVFAPWPDEAAAAQSALADVARAWDASGVEIGAVFVEPMQGRGGMRPAPPGFLAALGALARERGALLVADEIMVGLGRGGATWLSVAEGASPDLLCAGKALGGGLPMSACIGRPEVMASWGAPGGEAIHTATFFGHPLACASALAFLDASAELDLPARATRVGAHFRAELASRGVGGVRGRGLALAIELDRPGAALVACASLLAAGWIALPAGRSASALSLTPPIVFPDELVAPACAAIARALGEP